MDRFSLPAHSVGSVCSLSLLPLPLFPPCRWMEWPCRSPSWRSRSMAKITTCAFISARRKEEEGTTGEWDRREKKNHRPHLQQSTRRRKLEGEEETERAERGGEWKHRIEPTHPIIITVIVISFGPASLLFLILALLLFATTGSCHLSISVLGCLSASLILRSFPPPFLLILSPLSVVSYFASSGMHPVLLHSRNTFGQKAVTSMKNVWEEEKTTNFTPSDLVSSLFSFFILSCVFFTLRLPSRLLRRHKKDAMLIDRFVLFCSLPYLFLFLFLFLFSFRFHLCFASFSCLCWMYLRLCLLRNSEESDGGWQSGARSRWKRGERTSSH